MDRETIARLCEPFVQGDTRTSRRYAGTGLGLAICRRLADLMTGKLDIDSVPGKGTTVSISLPLPVAAPVPQQRKVNPTETHPDVASLLARAPLIESAAHAAPQPILVVDDHPTNRRLLVRQLAWLGYTADAAANGLEALERFTERSGPDSRYALVITDCQMPEMDGYELARRIRALESDGAEKTVLLAFTANTLREAADECHAAGMDDVLTKPIELKDLKTKLEHWLPAAPGVAASAPKPKRPVESSAISLTGEFCSAHESDMDALHEALRERQHDTVARAAHRIRGAALMYGDTPLAEAAAELERAARADGGWVRTETAARGVEEQTVRLFARAGWRSRRRAS
jgi:CheY-like chemotaxis protein/HPt (histidine-containing phosphotransfer) domain-containing protein